ncbi:hypothetical protein OK016_00200 [Vibrio chagasii]|nr:hypothetical protein [Vibrio chagasii]
MMTQTWPHSELVSGCASVTEGENITYTATLDELCGWRGDGDAATATITIADGATSGTTTVPARMMYT